MHHETIVVGAGPAGLQLAYFLQKRGRDYLVLEANGGPGSFFESQPRHRTLLSLNKRNNGFPEPEFNMRHDWNSLLTDEGQPLFREYSSELYPNADDLCRYMRDFATRHRLDIAYDHRVLRIDRDHQGTFSLEIAGGKTYSCKRLVMATGATRPRRATEIEGIEHAANYHDYDIDPAKYENKSVLIIGRGNSAFEVANDLAPHASIIHVAIGGRPLDLAWQTHFVGHVRAVNNTVVEMLHVKALHGAVGLTVRQISPSEGGGFTVIADEEVPNWQTPGLLELTLSYDHVIACTGYEYVTPEIFSPEIAPKSCPKNKYPILDSMWQSTTADVFYAGTAMAGRDKKSASSFIHGFRYNVRTLHHLLENKYHGVELPRESVRLENANDLRLLSRRLLKRLSTTAALYQQFGFLCDVLRLENGRCEILPEIPYEYAREQLAPNSRLILMSFEYGFHRYPAGTNPLNFITQMDEATSRRCAAYLHPVFRYYESGELVFEDNLGESLTLRFGPHRSRGDTETASSTDTGSSTDTASSADNVETHVLMNILNRAAGVTEERFSEEALLANHAFRPWPSDRPLRTEGLPRCTAQVHGQGGE